MPDVKRRLLLARLQVSFVALVGLLGLPGFSPYIGAGLDSSWAIAVSLAANRRLAFGRSFLFSYGPLGFLATPGFAVPAMGVVSVWVRIGFALLLGWLIARSVLAVAPMWAAAIITLVGVWVIGGAFSMGGEAVLVPLVVLLGGLVDLLATARVAIGLKTVTLLGALTGTSLLVKFDSGVWGLLFLLAGLTLHARAIRLSLGGLARRLGLAVVGFAAAVVVWWGLLRQPIGVLGLWLRGSLEVLLGYDRAMVANGGLWWELPVALLACGVALVLSWFLAPMGRRSYVCLLVSASAWLFTKQSFIRHDNGHVVRIFTMLSFVLLVLLGARTHWNRCTQWTNRTHWTHNDISVPIPDSDPLTGQSKESTLQEGVRLPKSWSQTLPDSSSAPRVWSVALVVIVACLAMVLHLTSYGRLRSVLPDTAMVPRAIGWLNNPDQVKVNRVDLLKNLKITSAIRKELLQGSVHIEPSETSVVLGIPEMQWNPLPIPQSYSAYTPWLDQKNADALSSESGPEQVLYESGSIDGRVSRFESPAAMVSLVCHYHQSYVDKRWTLFRRNVVEQPPGSPSKPKKVAPLNACEGPTIELKSLIGQFGQRVDLDIEGLDEYLIVGRFDGFEVTNQTRLQELLTRPSQFWFRIGDNRFGPYGRFVPATAGQPHILSMPSCLRKKLGSFDSGLFTNFAVFDAPPTSKRATAKTRARYRVRLEALPFRCPPV